MVKSRDYPSSTSHLTDHGVVTTGLMFALLNIQSDLILEAHYNRAQKALLPLMRVSNTVAGTEGLLGKKDGNKEDDLTPSDGSPALNTTSSTDRQIYEQFGETCEFWTRLLQTRPYTRLS